MIRWILAVATAVLCSPLGAQDPPPQPQTAVVSVVVVEDFNTLAETFATNELRAEQLYVGKTVQVTGTLSRVAVNPLAGTDGQQAYEVTLRQRGPWPADVEVTFFFPRAARKQLAFLTAGTEIVLQGRVDTPTTYPANGVARLKDFVTVAVTDCKLIGYVPPIVTLSTTLAR
jgi:hypothetical protein